MLRFEHLCKRYGDHTVFQDLHYQTDAGCVALNDEMGSGKSTLLAVLAGESAPDAGDVWIGGHSLRIDPERAKQRLAYVPEDCITYPTQTGQAYLERVAAARHAPLDGLAGDLIERFGLAAHRDKRFEQMSFGTRKKFFLTAAAIGKPAVVIVDEPTAGLEAAARPALIDLFRALGRQQTVFFCSYDTAFSDACAAKAIRFADLRKAG
ncbi:ABC transporter ATP-binding protein [Paraburkholderia ferrariae]|uniref:ABC transporter ATP-binding protein n=1 Tax=Paraburkholderia ferrariae TaxID=386056 RepID=UPI0004856BC9|nr:ABC transporter ATP-binding protein [Paraburkholderia ferrariae]